MSSTETRDFFYKNGHNFALFSSILKISVPKNIYILVPNYWYDQI